MSATSLQFTAVQGGANPNHQTVSVTNSGGGTLSGVTVGTVNYGPGPAGWVQVSSSGETVPVTVTIQPMVGGLVPGTYTASVPIQAPTASNTPQTVPVTLVVTAPPPAIVLTPGSLQFTATRGAANPGGQSIAINNGGGGTLAGLSLETVVYGGGASGWVQAALSGGTGPATLSVQPNINGLGSGTYTATIPVLSTAASNSPAVASVTLIVTDPPPSIGLSQSSLQFTALQGGANPASQTVTITNAGGGTLGGLAAGTISFGGGATGWLQVTLSGGTVPATLTIQPLTAGLSAGAYTATVPVQSPTASNSPQTVSISFEVTSTVVHHPVDPYLASPALGRLWEIPVLIITYLPTMDGINLDVLKNPDFFGPGPLTLTAVQARILDIVRRKKMALEVGSRFRGYQDPAALPSIGIRVVDHITVYELSPVSAKQQNLPGNPYHPDFFQIFQRLEVQRYVDVLGIRQIWFVSSSFDASFPSYTPGVHNPQDFRFYWESNMSSRVTGDISNSDRDPNDLPVYQHTYTVFGINFRRTQAEAIHNVGHQLEHMLSHVAGLQDGNTDLFWKKFVGQDALGQFITGRAGWTHMPPNTTTGYDYLNPTLVPSDIEDWTPNASGVLKPVNVNTWGSLVYPWPGTPDFSQRVESQWYVYWFQNHPGRGNRVANGSQWMSNWWSFFGDWDSAIMGGLGLYGSAPAAVAAAGSSRVQPFRFSSMQVFTPPVCAEPPRPVVSR